MDSRSAPVSVRAGDFERTAFVRKLRSTGIPICDIRRYDESARRGRVLEQLAEVQRSLAAIDDKIATYERFDTK